MRKTAGGWVAAFVAVTLAVGGCSSAPERSAPRPVPKVVPPAATPTPAPKVAPATAPVAVATPVPTAPLSTVVPIAPQPGRGDGGPPLPVPPPVPAAVAAYFLAPTASFATPAFAPGRQAFTNSDELSAILSGLAVSGAARSGSTEIRVQTLGASQSGQPIEALVFSRPVPPASSPVESAAAASSPAAVAPSPPQTRRPTVALVAGQHGDEPAGTEALLVVAQELAGGRLDAVLEHVDVVVVPRANPDGAALFQRGASDGTDVNRDHLLLRTPEAQALARLQLEFQPVVLADLHEYPVGGAFVEKFGAVPRHDVLFQYATVANMPAFVTRAAEEWFRLPLIASLRGAGYSADWYATTSADVADRRMTMGGIGAQIGRNAAGLRHAVSLLVETRGGGLGRVDLARRVQAQVLSVRSVLGNAAVHANDLVKLRQYVDRDTAARACVGEAIVDAAPTSSEYALAVIDAGTGAVRRIDVAWDSALALRPLKTRPRPCGYWLAATETDAVRRLRLLGVEVAQLDEGAELRGETYREVARQPLAGEAAGATRLVVQTVPALLDMATGGYYVSMAQPLADLALAALEPESTAGFAAQRVTAVGSVARILQRPDTRMSPLP